MRVDRVNFLLPSLDNKVKLIILKLSMCVHRRKRPCPADGLAPLLALHPVGANHRVQGRQGQQAQDLLLRAHTWVID